MASRSKRATTHTRKRIKVMEGLGAAGVGLNGSDPRASILLDTSGESNNLARRTGRKTKDHRTVLDNTRPASDPSRH